MSAETSASTPELPPIERPKHPRIFVQLGRAGDILNVLPLAFRAYQLDGLKPMFMVAADYAGLLSGVSYVNPVIYPGKFEEVIIALQTARRLTPNVVLTQIYGWGIANAQACASFARESWWASGMRVPWGSLPFFFDRRSRDREAILRAEVFGPSWGKRFVLVAATGTSSPFPYGPALLKHLRRNLGERFEVVDLSTVRADLFFDLLGLFDAAHCLVTIDTGHLHLAHASNIPVISLITRDPSPWHGSPWRPNHVARFFYDECPGAFDAIELAVRNAGLPLGPKLVHTWADWRDGDPAKELRGRTDVAKASWEIEYATGKWVPAEMTKAESRRSGKDFDDPHDVPFVHDVIEHGIARTKKGSDIVVLSNADVGFTPGLTGMIIEKIERFGAAFSHRRDFEKITEPFFSEAQVKRGSFYPGSDLFAFTVDWWTAHKAELGDYVMGREHWDEVFRQLIKYHGGASLDAASWHEWHVSFWCDAQRWTLPGNVHNAKLKEEWFKQTGFVAEDFRYFRVAEDGHLHPPTRK